jgi:hypothetical protein
VEGTGSQLTASLSSNVSSYQNKHVRIAFLEDKSAETSGASVRASDWPNPELENRKSSLSSSAIVFSQLAFFKDSLRVIWHNSKTLKSMLNYS